MPARWFALPCMMMLTLLLLTACGGAGNPTVTPTAIVPPTATTTIALTLVPPTPTSVPTPTAIPPIATPAPTPLPITLVPKAIGSATPVATGDRFTDPQGRFSFTQPKGWIPERLSDPDIVVQLNGDTPPGSFNVSTEVVPQGITLAQYVEAGLGQVGKSVAGYEPGPRGTQAAALGGEHAGLIDYYATVGGTKLYFLQIISMKNGTAYVLTFNTQPNDTDTYLRQAQVVLDSWRFL